MQITHSFIRWNLRVDNCEWWRSWTMVEHFLNKWRRRTDFIDEDDWDGVGERMDDSAGRRH